MWIFIHVYACVLCLNVHIYAACYCDCILKFKFNVTLAATQAPADCDALEFLLCSPIVARSTHPHERHDKVHVHMYVYANRSDRRRRVVSAFFLVAFYFAKRAAGTKL